MGECELTINTAKGLRVTINTDKQMTALADGRPVRCMPVELHFNGRIIIMTFIADGETKTMTFQHPEDMVNAAITSAYMMASFNAGGFWLDSTYLDRHKHVAALLAIGLAYPELEPDHAEKFILKDGEIDEASLKAALIGVRLIGEMFGEVTEEYE